MLGVSGNVPLKRIKDAWEKLYNADDINPGLNPKNLSNVLRDVGVNRAGQNVLFKELADMSDQLARQRGVAVITIHVSISTNTFPTTIV